MSRLLCWVGSAAIVAAFTASTATANTLYLSTTQAAGPTGNNQFGNGDVFSVDLDDTPLLDGTLEFDESDFADGNTNLNAFAIRPDGVTYLISTQGNENINGVNAHRRNVFAWNSLTDDTELFLDGNTLPGNGANNIDAIHELANGNLLFSTANDRDSWDDGDIVEYNRSATDTIDGLAPGGVRIIFSEADFGQNVDVDGISVNTGGNLLVSLAAANTTLDSTVYRDEDILEILVGGGYSMFFDGSARMTDNGQDINAFAYVPEPSSVLLMMLGLSGLAHAGRRRSSTRARPTAPDACA